MSGTHDEAKNNSQIIALAIQVFGTESKARRWLTSYNFALGATPESLLTTDRGLDDVKKVLASIAHGGVV